MVAVTNNFFSGTRFSSNERARQKAMPPLSPPKAIVNWSIPVNFTSRRRFNIQDRNITPRKSTNCQALDMCKHGFKIKQNIGNDKIVITMGENKILRMKHIIGLPKMELKFFTA